MSDNEQKGALTCTQACSASQDIKRVADAYVWHQPPVLASNATTWFRRLMTIGSADGQTLMLK